MNTNRAQFSIIILPYIYLVSSIENIIFYLIPVLIYFIERKKNLINLKYFKESLTFLFILIFYVQLIYDDTKFLIHDLRLREFISLFIVLELILFYFIIKKKQFRILNFFFLMFFVTQVSFSLIPKEKFDRSDFLKNLDYEFNEKIIIYEKSKKPVVLLVLDEYSSSSEIYRITKDSIDFKLEDYLSSEGFTIKQNFKTKSLRTSISLPSIFNFNIHNNLANDSIENIDKGLQIIPDFGKLLRKNLLIDSLNLKGVKSYSYGIFPFEKGINSADFNYYWDNKNPNQNILSKFISKTVIWTIIKNFDREASVFDSFRKSTIDKLTSVKFEENSFYYFHLYFPHDPFTYLDEYPSKKINYLLLSEQEYLDEHIRYKRWFNKKFISILEEKIDSNTRIIIAGDHGFRFNDTISAELTSGFFKNYSKESLNQIKVVQDIGYLINKSF